VVSLHAVGSCSWISSSVSSSSVAVRGRGRPESAGRGRAGTVPSVRMTPLRAGRRGWRGASRATAARVAFRPSLRFVRCGGRVVWLSCKLMSPAQESPIQRASLPGRSSRRRRRAAERTWAGDAHLLGRREPARPQTHATPSSLCVCIVHGIFIYGDEERVPGT
jgi:hypothetical protein